MGGTAAAEAHRLLLERGETVAVAESLTGGLLGAALTSVAGSSATFRGGVVAYATDLKVSLLGVDPDLLAHISPALMEHINPYGTYEFPVEAEYARTGYRPLRTVEAEG